MMTRRRGWIPIPDRRVRLQTGRRLRSERPSSRLHRHPARDGRLRAQQQAVLMAGRCRRSSTRWARARAHCSCYPPAVPRRLCPRSSPRRRLPRVQRPLLWWCPPLRALCRGSSPTNRRTAWRSTRSRRVPATTYRDRRTTVGPTTWRAAGPMAGGIAAMTTGGKAIITCCSSRSRW